MDLQLEPFDVIKKEELTIKDEIFDSKPDLLSVEAFGYEINHEDESMLVKEEIEDFNFDDQTEYAHVIKVEKYYDDELDDISIVEPVEDNLEAFNDNENSNASGSKRGKPKKSTWRITPENREKVEKRAKACVRGTYGRINETVTGKLIAVVNKTTLLLKHGLLVRAAHTCGFCDRKINLPIKYNEKGFSNKNLCYHFKNYHKFLYINEVAKGRPKENKVKVTSTTTDTFEPKYDHNLTGHLESQHNLKCNTVETSEMQIRVSSINEKQLQKQVENCVRQTYERMESGSKLEETVDETKLVMENEILIKADHICRFCTKVIPFYYSRKSKTGSVVWSNNPLKFHLKAEHDLKCKVKANKKLEEKMVEISTVSYKTDLEDRLKDDLRSIYERLDTKLDESKLEEAIESTGLILKDIKLVNGEHFCGFCNKRILLGYHRSKTPRGNGLTWCYGTIKNHFELVHKFKYSRQLSSRKESNTFKVTQTTRKTFEKKLKLALQRVYERLDYQPAEDFKEVIERTQLIVEGSKLMKGIHFCGFCSKEFNITYEKRNSLRKSNISWKTQIFKTHLKKDHNFILNLIK